MSGSRGERKLARPLGAAFLLLMATACGRAPGQPLDDDEKIVRAVLATLASDGKPVCADKGTSGRALTTFREFALAPRPSRDGLGWHAPGPFRVPQMPTQAEIDTAERQGREVRLPEPGDRRDDRLPAVRQSGLDGAALALSMPAVADRAISVDASWAPPHVIARWWPINRMKGDCTPVYMLSNPARTRGLAFVSVRADHWGTIYALEPQGGDWVTTAQWSAWLY